MPSTSNLRSGMEILMCGGKRAHYSGGACAATGAHDHVVRTRATCSHPSPLWGGSRRSGRVGFCCAYGAASLAPHLREEGRACAHRRRVCRRPACSLRDYFRRPATPTVRRPARKQPEGVKRREAPVRIAAPVAHLDGRAGPWPSRDRRPMTRAGAPSGASPRRFWRRGACHGRPRAALSPSILASQYRSRPVGGAPRPPGSRR